MTISNAFRSFAGLTFLTLFLGASAEYPGALPPPPLFKKGFDTITPAECKGWLTFLAGPETEGRGSGQPGFQKAADFMATRFKEFGLRPIGDNGTYFQNVPFSRSRSLPGSTALQLMGSGQTIAADGEIAVGGLGDDLNLMSSVVFVRASGKDAKLPADMPIKGKIVVVIGEADRRLRLALFRLEPAAVLTVGDVSGPIWRARPGTISRTPTQRVTGTISKEAVRALAKDLGATKIVEAPPDGDGIEVESGKGLVRLRSKIEIEQVTVPNVVGVLDGSDPKLKSEVVGIGAHLDHLGIQNGVVYPGADDDGSGDCALLAIAHALTSNPVKPKRTILFMAFCGEEMGLIGSSWYAGHPILPLEQMDCELQMDMVARDSYGPQNGDAKRMDKLEENHDTIRLVGSKRISTGLDLAIQEANKYVGFKFKYDAEDVYTRSDHYNFAAKGVPIAFVFDGFTPDYHQPTDTIDKINFDKLASVAKLYYLTIQDVASRDERLKKDVGGQ